KTIFAPNATSKDTPGNPPKPRAAAASTTTNSTRESLLNMVPLFLSLDPWCRQLACTTNDWRPNSLTERRERNHLPPHFGHCKAQDERRKGEDYPSYHKAQTDPASGP